eukprot:scaffold4077_cov70-Phaeocystis_antarctica.AAC.1
MSNISAVVGSQGQVKPPGCRSRVGFRRFKSQMATGEVGHRTGCRLPWVWDAALGATQRAGCAIGLPHSASRGQHREHQMGPHRGRLQGASLSASTAAAQTSEEGARMVAP